MDMTARSPALAADELAALLAAADEAPFSEVILTAIERRDPAARAFAEREDGRLRAYGVAVPNPDGQAWTLEVAAPTLDDPAYSQVVGRILDALGEDGVAQVVLWVHDDRSPADERLRQERELHRMAAALPIDERARWPAGVEVRGFRPGRDEAAWLAVNNAAFAGHPEQSGWTVTDLRRRYEHGWFDPEGIRMIWRADELLAFNWTKVVQAGDTLVGEIFVIAVHPEHHGMGLGKATAIEGLRDLHERRHATRAQLYVDAANPAGMALYRGLGFESTHVSKAYRAVVSSQ